jgi:hypothetical protein
MHGLPPRRGHLVQMQKHSRRENCNNKNFKLGEGLKMTNAQICELYGRKLNMTLRELSAITGKTIPELKKILLNN